MGMDEKSSIRFIVQKKGAFVHALVIQNGKTIFPIGSLSSRIADTFPVHFQHWNNLMQTIVSAAIQKKIGRQPTRKVRT